MQATTDQSKVITLLAPLTFNTLFLQSFVAEAPPCAALGIVETARRQKGFIALKTQKEITDYQHGFDLGIQLLGKGDGCAVLHLIFNFSNESIYDVLLNLGATATKRVLKVWKQTNDYFFFVFQNGGLTAFHQKIGGQWYEHNYFEIMDKSDNTAMQYDRAVQSFKRNHWAHGTLLNLKYQENPDFLDLKENRFEVTPRR